MPVFRTCLCWHDVRTGSVAAGVFTMTLSFLQILLQIAIWTANESTREALENSAYIVYIPLAALDFLVVVFSVVLLIGIERDQKGRHMLMPWLIIVSIYLCYETAINIYFFVASFPRADELNEGVGTPGSMVSPWARDANILPMLIVIVVYWLLKVFLHVLGLLCVLSRFQELPYYRRRYGRRTLDESFEVAMPRPRDYTRYLEPAPREYRVRETYRRDREPYYGAAPAPPRYPHDREERARADYNTPRPITAPAGGGGGGYLDPKRFEGYGGSTPYPGTPRIYPRTENLRY